MDLFVQELNIGKDFANGVYVIGTNLDLSNHIIEL